VLTRVEISGFKSFQDFVLDLEPLLMVLGPNGAGKSNLFDALALISRCAEMELTKALQGGRGSIRDQFAHTAVGIAETMSFAVELLLAGSDVGAPLAQTRFRYELTVGRERLQSGVEALNVVREKLHPIARAEDTWIDAHPSYERFARYQDVDVLLELLENIDQVVEVFGGDIQRELRALGQTRAGSSRDRARTKGDLGGTSVRGLPAIAEKTLLAEGVGLHITAVRHELSRWRFLRLGMAALREPSERSASTRMTSDGANLSTALAALPEEARAHIRADLVTLVPGLKTLQVTERADEFGFEATFSDGQHYSQRVLSDGTLRLVALLTVLHSSDPGALILYEEPENGLHPGRLRDLLRWLRELAEQDDALPIQTLMNGHSPAIVAGLRDLPDSLVFLDVVRRKDGVRRTNARRIAPSGELATPGITVSTREVEALLDAVRPEIAE
jgi:predicted ATPase